MLVQVTSVATVAVTATRRRSITLGPAAEEGKAVARLVIRTKRPAHDVDTSWTKSPTYPRFGCVVCVV